MRQNTSNAIAPSTWRRGSTWGKGGLALLTLFVGAGIFVNSLPYFSSTEAGFLRTKADVLEGTLYLPAFYAHVSVGFIVLVTGFVSLSRRVRRRQISGHRVAGKMYVSLVLTVMAPSGLVMGLYASGGLATQMCFVLLASLWGYYTARAYRAIRGGDVEAHRLHMYRSYALALSAVTLRIYSFLAAYYGGLHGPEVYQIMVWLSWVPNLLFVEVYYRTKRTMTYSSALSTKRSGAQRIAR